MTPAVIPSGVIRWIRQEEALGDEPGLGPVEDFEPAVTKTSKTRKTTIRKDVLGEVFEIVTKASPILTIARKGAIAL